MPTPHDDLFHFVFQHVRHAAAWLRACLPHAVVETMDWPSLRPAPEKLRGQALRLSVADLVFCVERHPTRTPVWILSEHKAQGDPEVEAQLLRYVVHLRDRAPRLGVATPVPVVPVLLHHGETPFAPTPHEGDDAIAAWQPRLPFVVDDLRSSSEPELRARPTTPLGTLTLLCLRTLRGLSGAEALLAFERWADLLRAADRDAGPPRGREVIAAVARYALHTVEIAPRDLHATFERLLQRPEDTIMSTAEKLKREGRAEGKAEGKAESVLRLLGKRFGAIRPELVDRVRAGTLSDLDRWLDRILDAKTADELFAD